MQNVKRKTPRPRLATAEFGGEPKAVRRRVSVLNAYSTSGLRRSARQTNSNFSNDQLWPPKLLPIQNVSLCAPKFASAAADSSRSKSPRVSLTAAAAADAAFEWSSLPWAHGFR